MVCRERAVSPDTLAAYAAEMEHDGRKYDVSVANFQVLRCQNCGELFLDEAANERLSDALRAAVGLLAPAEIREKREDLGLTQKQLASLLRISEFTLCRWETGAQLQQRSMDAFLRVFFEAPEARRILGAPEMKEVGVTVDAQTACADYTFQPHRTPHQDPQEAGLGKGFGTFTPVQRRSRPSSDR
jgi:putative zinc finger/helix-turn-helix YgiT family protein